MWIGCLSCYNSGTLRGAWITAEQAAAEIDADQITYGGIAKVETHGTYTAPRCQKCGGDEFEALDHENVPAAYKYVAKFYEAATDLVELSEADGYALLLTYADNVDPGGYQSITDLAEQHTENYAGEFDTPREFGEEMADIYEVRDDTHPLAAYINYEAYARDLLTGDYWNEGRHYWRSN